MTPVAYRWRQDAKSSWQYSTWFAYARDDVADKRARGYEVEILAVMP